MKLGRIIGIGIVLLVIAGFLSAGLVQAAGKLPKQASIATHRVGGIFHAGGVGIAKVVANHTPLKIVVKPFSGPSTYMPMINTGEIDMGLPNALDTKYAFDGNPILRYKRMNHERLLLPGGMNVGMIPIAARKDSGIRTISDLKGKRVASDFGGHLVIALEMEAHLALGGLTWDDVVKVPVVDYKDGLRAIREGRVDAGFIGNYYGAATLDLLQAVELYPMPLDTSNPKYVKRFQELLPGFEIRTVQPTMWLKQPTTVVAFRINLVAYDGFSADAGYLIVKTLYENYKELNAVGGILKTWKPDLFFDPKPLIPYHPGAVKYYKEKGLWTSKLDKLQKELLEKAK